MFTFQVHPRSRFPWLGMISSASRAAEHQSSTDNFAARAFFPSRPRLHSLLTCIFPTQRLPVSVQDLPLSCVASAFRRRLRLSRRGWQTNRLHIPTYIYLGQEQNPPPTNMVCEKPGNRSPRDPHRGALPWLQQGISQSERQSTPCQALADGQNNRRLRHRPQHSGHPLAAAADRHGTRPSDVQNPQRPRHPSANSIARNSIPHP